MRIAPLFLATALGFVTLPGAARAQQEPAGPPPAMDSTAFDDLGLTADQRSKITAIHQQIQQQNAPLREQMRQILGGKSYRDLTPAERDSLRPKLEPIRRQMMDNGRSGREQIMAILTPEQRRKLAAHVRERRGRAPEEHE